MLRKVFYAEDEIVGYSDDIIEDVLDNYDMDDENNAELFGELLRKLKQYDYDLVICHYHPMGAWTVKKVVAVN